ncbi:hypothetical protein C8Q76DRAFT_794430 [Earliella scabrosa]|nr:hypothetical protein C8Q76DRAFT_794430 [Earliella scabrosa]
MLLFLDHGVLTVDEFDLETDHTEYVERLVERKRWAKDPEHSSFKKIRWGTLPYMSAWALSDRTVPYTVADDCVLCGLSPPYGPPSTFPETQPPARWPASIKCMFYHSDYTTLSAWKRFHFAYDARWRKNCLAVDALPYWKNTAEGKVWHDLLVELHDNAVWKPYGSRA